MEGGRDSHDPFSIYDGHDLLKVTACKAAEVRALGRSLARASCRILSEPGELVLPRNGGCAVVQATCPPEAHDARPTGPGVEILHQNAGEAMRSRAARFLTVPLVRGGQVDLRRNGIVFYDEFRNADDVTDRIRELVRLAPGIAELIELEPATTEKRHILAVRLRGKLWQPGSPRVLFTYTLHAREWISTMAGVYALEHTILAAAENPEDFANVESVFVPLSNPDGFVHSSSTDRFWRKNKGVHEGCEGVDLNRNFNWQWHRRYDKYDEGDIQAQDSLKWEAATCGEVFGGLSPSSEPEVLALQSIAEDAPLTVHVDFHSCGGYILGPWSFMQNAHPRMDEVKQLGNSLQEAIKNFEGSLYEFCTGNSCLYPVAGDFPDYTTALGALGFTIEMRPIVRVGAATYDDFAPDPVEILPNAKENFLAVQAAIRFAKSKAPNP